MKKIIVVKMGRNIATSKRNKVDSYRFEHLAKQISELHKKNISVMLVISAAVSCGEHEMGLRGSYEVNKQLVGGVGQAAVIAELYTIFLKHNLTVGQLLVTKNDLEDSQKRNSISSVIWQASENNIVLVINENDIVELHSFGGNDYLATEIAKIAYADKLMLLTDVDGVLDEKKQVIGIYKKSSRLSQIKKEDKLGGVGGMSAKLDAAMGAADNGITTWISHGKTQNLLTRVVLSNERIGTEVAEEYYD